MKKLFALTLMVAAMAVTAGCGDKKPAATKPAATTAAPAADKPADKPAETPPAK
jgi:predicted small lipoprotein YifL